MSQNSDHDTNTTNSILNKTPENQYLQSILSNFTQIQDNFQKFKNFLLIHMKFKEIINLIDSIASIVKGNILYFAGNQKLKDDFHKTFSILKTFLRYISKLSNSQIIQDTEILVNNADIDIINNLNNNIISSLTIFHSILKEIIILNTNANEDHEIFNLQLGINFALFNSCVEANTQERFPFLKCKFIQIYQYYNLFNQITDNVSLIKSYSSTGKTLCIPLFLLSKSLRENEKVSFVLMMLQTSFHTNIKIDFFKKHFGKYIKIIDDPKELIQIYDDYSKGQIGQKLTLAIFSINTLMTLNEALKNNQIFVNNTRFIIDDIHQKTLHNSVIIY